MGFDVDKPKRGTKSKIPKKRMEQIEQYVDDIDDNTKQFARELNDLPTSEDNQDTIILQDIINKNEIASDNNIKLTETLTEISVDVDKEKRKLEQWTNDETYSDERRQEVQTRLQESKTKTKMKSYK